MKCPKCQYLGFEAGDRCRNCGYEFSLIEVNPRGGDSASERQSGSRSYDAWDSFDAARDVPVTHDAALRSSEGEELRPAPPLPLFAVTAEEQPLVRLPATPRRPLSVRKTPEGPRVRATSRHGAHVAQEVEPELDFPTESTLAPETLPDVQEHPAAAASRVPAPSALLTVSSPRRRFLAAAIDYLLLAGIDIAIVYFTVRMAGLDMSDWRLLPVVPLALFLVVIALAYVGVFTAIGGQTIGKMAARIRVVSDDPVPVGVSRAVARTAAVAVSWLTGGLGFLPALVGEHRALHDRLSRTRVVDLV